VPPTLIYRPSQQWAPIECPPGEDFSRNVHQCKGREGVPLISHHLPHPLPHPSLPVQSRVHVHALSPSLPSYLLFLGSTLNAIASSARVVEHRLTPFFYELMAAAVIRTFHQVRHTSHTMGMMVVRRPHSHPSGLIGNSCFVLCIIGMMRSV
jgi:hypothetical protein